MNQERWQQIESLYHSALELPALEDRAAFLDEACAGDTALREELDSLLAQADDRDDFLSRPRLTLGFSLLANDHHVPVQTEQIGHYRIIKHLARGGMGEVYLARDARLERMVALKILPKFLNQQSLNIARFEQEARAASCVSHPNIAHVYDVGEAEGQRYIAMEYVKGDNLRALLGHESLSASMAVDVALQVAQALGAAHDNGIVHRDIKPENILIRDDRLVKVVDFGLAKLTEPQRVAPERDSNETQPGSRVLRTVQTEAGMLMGTVNYMSPEQARGLEVDARTDIWSWGVVFYEMLAGRPPFTGATQSDVIAEVLKSEPQPLRGGLPDSVNRILQRSLRKDKNERYGSISELLPELYDLRRQIEEETSPHDTPPQTVNVRNQTATAANGSSETGRQVNRSDEIIDLSTADPPAVNAEGLQTPSSKSIGQRARPLIKRAPRSALFLGSLGLLAVVLAVIIYNFIGRRQTSRVERSGALQISQLTADGHVMDAAISADARLLAFVTIDSGRQSLWVRNLGSGEKWQLLPPDPALCWGLRFTPNGQSLLYITTQPSSTISVLYRIPVRGGSSNRLVVNLDSPPAISPDGMQIAFVRSYPAQHRDALVVANIDGSDEREIAARVHPDKFSFSGISWSPDGKLISLGASRNDEAEFALIGIPAVGGAPVELTPWQWKAVRGVEWENDGVSLIFSARAADSRYIQLWRVSYPGGKVERITNDDNSYEEITLAHNEPTLVTTRTYEVSNIFVADQSGSVRSLTSEGHAGGDGLTLTPGGRVVYTVGEDEQSVLWSMNMEGGDRRPLAENSGFLPAASRDGRFIAYASKEHDAHHIWVMDTDGRNNRQLTDGGGENYPSLTPDGNWVIYTSLGRERGSLWKVSTGGGEPLQLTHGAIIIRPVVSPDGNMIACTYRQDETDKWKIAVLPAGGGTPLKTFAFPYPYNQIIRWTPDSKALIYLDKREGVHNLWRQLLDGSQPAQLTNFTEDQILHYALPDAGTGFVLSRGGKRRDIMIIKNFR